MVDLDKAIVGLAPVPEGTPTGTVHLRPDAEKIAEKTLRALTDATESGVMATLAESGTGGTLVDGGTNAVPVVADITRQGPRGSIPTVEDNDGLG